MSSPPQPTTSSPPAVPLPPEMKLRRRDDLPLREMDWLGSFLGGLRRGGIYLLGGAPGSRKSGLAVQIALDLARQNIRSLFLLTEESAERLYDRAMPMTDDWSRQETCAGIINMCAETDVPAMTALPQLVRQQILSPAGRWHASEISMLVIDSAQGRGLSSAATRDYAGLIEAAQAMGAAGITVMIINQMTKGGRLAGPTAVEHAVDVAMVVKATAMGRALVVTKNRFGATVINDPLLLEIDDVTLRLAPSARPTSSIAVARTYGGGWQEVVEVQARLELPPFTGRGKLLAPHMPRAELQQLMSAISRISRIGLDDGGCSIELRVPGWRNYLPHMDLAVAAALIGAYLRLPVPVDALFIGEVDLAGGIRCIDLSLLNQLTADVNGGATLTEPRTLYCHPATAIAFHDAARVHIRACRQLEQMVYGVWPSLR